MQSDLQKALNNMPGAKQTRIGEGMTSAGRLDKMLGSNSPLMKRAATQGKQQSQSRGLLNSSMAAGSAQGAMIDRAQPFAMQDSNNLIQNAQRNTEAQNRRGLLQAGLIGDSYKSEQQQGYQQDNMSLADQIRQGQMRLDNTLGQSDMKLADRIQQTQMELNQALEQGNMELANSLQRDLNEQQQGFEQSNMRLGDTIQQKQMKLSQALEQGNMQLANSLQKELNDQGYDHQRGLNSQNFDIQSALGDQSYLHDLGRASQGFDIQSALNDQGYIQNVGLIGAELGANQQMSSQDYQQQLGLNQQQGNIQSTLNQQDYNFRSNLSQQEFSQNLQRATQDFGFQSSLAKKSFQNGMNELYGSANANGWGVMANSVTDTMANSARRIDQIQMNPNISEEDKAALIKDVQDQTDNMINIQQGLLGDLGNFMEETGVFPDKPNSPEASRSGTGNTNNQNANSNYRSGQIDQVKGYADSAGVSLSDAEIRNYLDRSQNEGLTFGDIRRDIESRGNSGGSNSGGNQGSAIGNLYQDTLGRAPKGAALNHYRNKIESGEMTLNQVKNELKNSPEGKISDLFRKVFNRIPGEAARDHYIAKLSSGEMTVAQIEQELKSSDEYRRR